MTANRRSLVAMIATLPCLAVAGAVVADHIPGHSNGDPTFPMPNPGQEFFSGNGQITFVTLIGPDEGVHITNTTFEIISGFSSTFLCDADEPMVVTIPSPTRAIMVSSVAPPTSVAMFVRTVTRAFAFI